MKIIILKEHVAVLKLSELYTYGHISGVCISGIQFIYIFSLSIENNSKKYYHLPFIFPVRISRQVKLDHL